MSALSRGLSADAVLDVRRRAAQIDQKGAARLQGRGQAGPGQAGEAWHADPCRRIHRDALVNAERTVSAGLALQYPTTRSMSSPAWRSSQVVWRRIPST